VANLTMNNFEIFKNNVTDHCLLTWKQVRCTLLSYNVNTIIIGKRQS
jgi:hypothetical protein